MNTLISDLKYAVRQLIKSPSFTAVAVLTLAIGIGANVGIFGFVRSVLIDPLPVRDADRLVQIQGMHKEAGQIAVRVNPPTIMELKEHSDLFNKLVVSEDNSLTFPSEPFQERVQGNKVSPDFFDMWGVPPLLGRTFTADEGTPGQDRVIVLSHGFWKRRFGARSDVIGETIRFNETALTIVGVMPAAFQFPKTKKEYWIPSVDPAMPHAYDYRSFELRGRLQTGVTLDQVQTLLDTVAARHSQDHPQHNRGFGLTVRPLRAMFATDTIRKSLVSLMAVVGFILLIACANLTNLLFARTEDRRQELAIRNALGAGRWRLLRQLLTESVCLAVMGGLCGLLVCHWSLRGLTFLIPENMPQLKPVEMDVSLLGYALLLSVAVGIGIGLLPAWFTCQGKAHKSPYRIAVTRGLDRRRRHLSRFLVGLEVALAVVLLGGAGLMVASVIKLLRVDPGYDPTSLTRVYLTLPHEKYHDLERKNLFLKQLHQTWSTLPGINSVGICVYHWGQPAETWSGPNGTPLSIHKVGCGVGRADYLRSIGARLTAGRHLEERDVGPQQRTLLVNTHLARRFGLGSQPVGRIVTRHTPDGQIPYEVIGVVEDVQEYALNQVAAPIYYRPYQEIPLGPSQIITVRTDMRPRILYTRLSEELKALEPAFIEAPTFEAVSATLYKSTTSHRLYMQCLIAAAAVGVALAALGIYGVLARAISLRTKEIGIRMALGALPSDIICKTLRQAMGPVLVGIAVGLAGTFCLVRFIEGLLFDISPHNPLILTGVVLLFLAVAAIAAWIPARRAAHIDPMEALRYE